MEHINNEHIICPLAYDLNSNHKIERYSLTDMLIHFDEHDLDLSRKSKCKLCYEKFEGTLTLGHLGKPAVYGS